MCSIFVLSLTRSPARSLFLHTHLAHWHTETKHTHLSLHDIWPIFITNILRKWCRTGTSTVTTITTTATASTTCVCLCPCNAPPCMVCTPVIFIHNNMCVVCHIHIYIYIRLLCALISKQTKLWSSNITQRCCRSNVVFSSSLFLYLSVPSPIEWKIELFALVVKRRGPSLSMANWICDWTQFLNYIYMLCDDTYNIKTRRIVGDRVNESKRRKWKR